MMKSVSSAVESKNSIFFADQSFVCRWFKISLIDWNDKDAALLLLFMIWNINRDKFVNCAEKKSLSLTDWFALKLLCSDIFSQLLICLLSLMIELFVKEKLFSNFLIVFLKSDLSVVHSKNQDRNKSKASDVARIRSKSMNVWDLNWSNVISVNLFFVIDFIKEANWCSIFIKSMSWKVRKIISVLIIRLSMSEKSWTFY